MRTKEGESERAGEKKKKSQEEEEDTMRERDDENVTKNACYTTQKTNNKSAYA